MTINDDFNPLLMDLRQNMRFNQEEMVRLQDFADTYNRALELEGRGSRHEMGEAEFLRLLMVQLQNQDPSNPMEDRDFIAQTTQLNSLQQTRKMAGLLEQLNVNFMNGQNIQTALSFVGREVEMVRVDGQSESGRVQSLNLTTGQIRINNRYFNPNEVTSIIARDEQPIVIEKIVHATQQITGNIGE
jgi:flagellar basal-body rod modification protein FlgD